MSLNAFMVQNLNYFGAQKEVPERSQKEVPERSRRAGLRLRSATGHYAPLSHRFCFSAQPPVMFDKTALLLLHFPHPSQIQ